MDDFAAGLQTMFNALQRDAPDLAAGATPLSRGGHGFVIDHGDNSLTKVFLRADDPANQPQYQRVYDDEVNVLRLLNGTPVAGAAIPALLQETTLPASDTTFAAYRMTRVPGQPMLAWDYFAANHDPAVTEPHFRQVGALLADFHTLAAARLDGVTPPARPWFDWGTGIVSVPALGDAVNTELAAADRYLRAHMQPGMAHGDFHTSNYLVDSEFNITGLFDFSFAGRHDNGLIDFAMLPDAQREIVLTEYEQRTGRDIDRTLVTATALSLDARIMHWAAQNPDGIAGRTDVAGRMAARLDAIRPTTMG